MIKESNVYNFQEHKESLQVSRGDEPLSPLKLFRHKDLLSDIRSAPVISKKKLVNIINFLHFMRGSIFAHVSDPKYHEDFLISCCIESYTEQEIRCSWPEDAAPVTEKGRPLNLIVEDGLSLVVFPIRVTSFDDKGFSVQMPDKGYLLGKRCIRRNACRNITATLSQKGFLADGDLIDFSPLAFRVRFRSSPETSFFWMNKDHPFSIQLKDADGIIFSGPCRTLRQTDGRHERDLVLAPMEKEIQRLRKQKARSPRLCIVPPPSAHFEHPFFRRPVQRDICDLTFSGFAIEEKADESVLMPGMIIPKMEIRYAGILKLYCEAQVIYRRNVKKGRVRYGLAILDIDFRSYRHLSHIMVHAGNAHARFNTDVDPDALWEFFFDAGFIYPKKYSIIQSYREEFKDTFSKLCQDTQDIEAHFTYQENGRIYGYASIIRAYPRAWMVHHLAARPFDGNKTGLSILKNIHWFCAGLSRYPTIRMDYMVVYFRPDNYFPNSFFGGFARDIANPKICSMDLFAYMSYPTNQSQSSLPQGWQLTEFETGYLPQIEHFYRNVSGGLLLNVLRLGQTDNAEENIEKVFDRQGFMRQSRTHVLTQGQTLKALFIVDHSSLGLNLSEFLNSIKIIVTDPEGVSWKVLNSALARLAKGYPVATSIPLLIYPATYPTEQGLKIDRQYMLWIADTQCEKEYMEHMEQQIKITPWLLLKHLLRKLVPK